MAEVVSLAISIGKRKVEKEISVVKHASQSSKMKRDQEKVQKEKKY